MKEFNHLRKSEPIVINWLSWLRAISITSGMTAFIDALLLDRCQATLETAWGPEHGGGISEGLATVLALVLLRQLRLAAGLTLILIFLDLVAAFDVAARDDMRVAAFEAGVSGKLWMLIDDLLSDDACRVHLKGLVSPEFRLSIGTAQGRRISITVKTHTRRG